MKLDCFYTPRLLGSESVLQMTQQDGGDLRFAHIHLQPNSPVLEGSYLLAHSGPAFEEKELFFVLDTGLCFCSCFKSESPNYSYCEFKKHLRKVLHELLTQSPNCNLGNLLFTNLLIISDTPIPLLGKAFLAQIETTAVKTPQCSICCLSNQMDNTPEISKSRED